MATEVKLGSIAIVPNKPCIENIVICGVGAAGSNILQHLLYAFPTLNYTVVDFDKVEVRNFEAGTQPYSKIDLNRPKTQAIQRIAMAIKEKRINAVNTKIVSVNDLKNLTTNTERTLFIDAFDNAISRNIFISLNPNVNVIHVGFSNSLNGEVVWNGTFTTMETSKKDNEIDVCEMTLARPFIFALTALAAMAISTFLETGKKENVYFDRYFILKKF
jgi:hypothetical protein